MRSNQLLEECQGRQNGELFIAVHHNIVSAKPFHDTLWLQCSKILVSKIPPEFDRHGCNGWQCAKVFLFAAALVPCGILYFRIPSKPQLFLWSKNLWEFCQATQTLWQDVPEFFSQMSCPLPWIIPAWEWELCSLSLSHATPAIFIFEIGCERLVYLK